MHAASGLLPIDARLSALDRRPWLVLGAVLLLLAMQLKGWWTPGNDAAGYLSIARNMAERRLARFGSPHLHFAPGYPALIAPAWLVSDSPFWLIGLIHLGLAAALAAGVYQWMRRVQPSAAVLLTTLVLVNVSLWEAYRMTHSELAFMVEIVWGAYCLEKAAASHTVRETLAWLLLGTVLTSAAVLTRQVGVFLVAGFGATLLVGAIRRQERWSRAIALTAAVGLPVTVATLTLVMWDRGRAAQVSPTQKSYAQYFVDDTLTPVQQVVEGVRLRITECGQLLIPGMVTCYGRPGRWFNICTLTYLAVLPVLLVGWVKLTRRSPDTLLLMLPFYTAMYTAWPFSQGTRYMLPMLPILWAAVAEVFANHGRKYTLFAGLAAAHVLVAIGYWLYGGQAVVAAKDWQPLNSIAQQLVDPGDTVQLLGLDETQAQMLRLQANRPLPVCDEPQAAEAANLLVGYANGVPPLGFTLRHSDGRFALWERTAELQTTRATGHPTHQPQDELRR